MFRRHMILTILSPYLQIANRKFVYKLDPNFAEKIRHIRDPKARMAVVWAHCKGKMICEPDDPKEEGADGEAEEGKKGHGGCGHNQPVVRKEGLKLFVQYKKTKDDDDVSNLCHYDYV